MSKEKPVHVMSKEDSNLTRCGIWIDPTGVLRYSANAIPEKEIKKSKRRVCARCTRKLN